MAPGPIWPPLQISGGATQEKLKQFGGHIPLGRPGQPEGRRRPIPPHRYPMMSSPSRLPEQRTAVPPHHFGGRIDAEADSDQQCYAEERQGDGDEKDGHGIAPSGGLAWCRPASIRRS
ncbi:hypothetical protein A6A40_17815 (plasmid) [Azospirillum humicireducens]|uniref:Uncharacterized protein n=1 Tax=Azospirillum humicireducens TaxID=1226968 RepID=A0A2R4VR38_9PROT|nr:hypothetical protein A6A40_17815 [Azospirillum humicireducens]